MYLRWDYLFGAILFFAVFLFQPLLRAVGDLNATIIVCVGLVCIAIVKVVEYFTCRTRDHSNDDVSHDIYD